MNFKGEGMKLEAKEILRIHVQCGKDLEVKNVGGGYLRVIPIIGGYFEGEINGTVVPGGADWNTQRANGISHVYAKYVLKTDDDVFISIQNEGNINFSDTEQRIKTVPQFQVDENSKYGWLNSGVYVGTLEVGKEGRVEIRIYKLS